MPTSTLTALAVNFLTNLSSWGWLRLAPKRSIMDGWYYLHTNGDLIYKRDLPGTAADIRESPFAVMLWPIDRKDRATAWRELVKILTDGCWWAKGEEDARNT